MYNKTLTKILAILLTASFCADSTCYGLSPLRTSQSKETILPLYQDLQKAASDSSTSSEDISRAVKRFCNEKNTIGITGATGVIGSALVDRLIEENPSIRLNVLVRKSSKPRPEWAAILKKFPDNINVIEGDLMDMAALNNLACQSDVIFHVALDSREDFTSHDTNGTDKTTEILVSNTVPGAILSSLADAQKKPFIFSSSYGVFFHVMDPPKGKSVREEDVALDKKIQDDINTYQNILKDYIPLLANGDNILRKHVLRRLRQQVTKRALFAGLSNHQLYAVQKLINEYIIKECNSAIALRIGNIYGPGDAAGRPVPALIDAVKAGKTQEVPNFRRSFIYLGDAVEALLRAAVAVKQGEGLEKEDRVISVAYPELYDSLYVAEKIKSQLGVDTKLKKQNGPQKNEDLELDLSRMKRILSMDIKNLTPLDQGLWFTLNPPAEVKSIYDIVNRNVDKKRVCLVALNAEQFPFTGESAGVGAMSGFIAKNRSDVAVDVFDMQVDRMEDIIKMIRLKRPAILGISVKLKTFDQLMRLRRMIGERIPFNERPLIVLGGTLPAFVTDSLLTRYFPDAVVGLGEGEVSMGDLVEYVNGNMPLAQVRNIAYVDKHKVVYSEKRETLPPERFTLPDRRRTKEFFDNGGIVYAEQSRGCPWGNCTICASQEVLGSKEKENKWRPMPLETVMEDLDNLQAMGVDVVRYTDEEFFGFGKDGLKRAREFAEEKIRRGNKAKFDIMARIDSVYDENDTPQQREARIETLKLLKEAGLIKISLGAESFSQSQLLRYAKGITVKEIEEALKIVRELNIPLGIGFIPCDPLCSMEEIAENLSTLNSCGALMESSVCFNEIRVQEKSGYERLMKHAEDGTGEILLGPLDLNSLNYPVIRYQDPRVDIYTRNLRCFYDKKNIYKIIYLLRIYTQYHSQKNDAVASPALAEHFYGVLSQLRNIDYSLTTKAAACLTSTGATPEAEEKVRRIIAEHEILIGKLLLPFLVEIEDLRSKGVLENTKQVQDLADAIKGCINQMQITPELYFETLEQAYAWTRDEFQPMENHLRRLKMGRKLAKESPKLLSSITSLILKQAGLSDEVAVASYGSAGGQFMVHGSDTDFVIISKSKLPEETMARLRSILEAGLNAVPGSPWLVSFKSWDDARTNPGELRCMNFIGGSREVFESEVTKNEQVRSLVNNETILAASVVKSDLYMAFISSKDFSLRLMRILSDQAFPQMVGYGDIKYHRGGLRQLQAIIRAASLYSKADERFKSNTDMKILVEKGIITAEDLDKLYEAMDFMLAARDILVKGYNITLPENMEALKKHFNMAESEIEQEYLRCTRVVIALHEKILKAVKMDYRSSMGVAARNSANFDQLITIIGDEKAGPERMELWSVLALRADLPSGIRSYLKEMIKKRKEARPHSLLDEMETMVEWSEQRHSPYPYAVTARTKRGLFRDTPIPFLELHLTNACNQACEWCTYSNADRSQYLKLEDLKKIAAFLPSEVLIAGGGEPTMYSDGDKDFNDAVSRLRELLPAAKLRLITNGVLVPAGDWQEKIDEISISLDEPTRAGYKNMKKRDLFERVWKNIIEEYLSKGPIASVRVTKVYSASNLMDSIQLAAKLYRALEDLRASGAISDEKRQNFKFMIFPMANDESPDAPYKSTRLSKEQQGEFRNILDRIKTEERDFWQFMAQHTNLMTQPFKELETPPASKCWAVSNYALVGADGVIYPCFAGCACGHANLGSINQVPGVLFEGRTKLFMNPQGRCTKGCRPQTTFYGLRAFELFIEQTLDDLDKVNDELQSTHYKSRKAFEAFEEKANIMLWILQYLRDRAADKNIAAYYQNEINNLNNNIDLFSKLILPKKIVHVSFQDPDHLKGGQGWAVLNIIKEQIRQGFEVDWISPCVRDEKPGEYLYFDGKLKVIKVKFTDEKVLGLYANTEHCQELRRLFGDAFTQYIQTHYKQQDCTVHLQGFIEVPRRAKELREDGFNVVSTFHMLLSPRAAETNESEPVVSSLRAVEIEAIKSNDRIIVNSEGMADAITRICPDYKGSLQIIRNGIGDEFFDAPPAGNGKKMPVVTTYGRISPEKGFDTFIEAAKIVTERRRKQNKPDAEFVIFGNSDDAIEARRVYLQKLHDDARGCDYIKIIASPDGLQGDEKMAQIDRSTIGVVPSFYEPFGLVIPEIMARRLPIVTTLEPGARDILQADKAGETSYGFVVEKRSAESLADALEWLMDHPDEAREMGHNAYERAKYYKWSPIVSETTDIYQQRKSPKVPGMSIDGIPESHKREQLFSQAA